MAHPTSLQHKILFWQHPIRRLHYMDRNDASDIESDDQMDRVMAAITDLPRRLHMAQASTELLQTQVPVFKKQQTKYIEFKHLLLSHIRPFQNNLTEEDKRQFFLDPLREDSNEVWQTLQVNLETTVQECFSQNQKRVCTIGFQRTLAIKTGSIQI